MLWNGFRTCLINFCFWDMVDFVPKFRSEWGFDEFIKILCWGGSVCFQIQSSQLVIRHHWLTFLNKVSKKCLNLQFNTKFETISQKLKNRKISAKSFSEYCTSSGTKNCWHLIQYLHLKALNEDTDRQDR